MTDGRLPKTHCCLAGHGPKRSIPDSAQPIHLEKRLGT